MLASTVQFSNNDQAHHQPPTPNHPPTRRELAVPDQWPPTIPHTPPPLPRATARCRLDPKKPHATARLFPQDPTVCLAPTPSPPAPFLPHRGGAYSELAGSKQAVVDVPPVSTTHHTFGDGVDPGPTGTSRRAGAP